MWDQSNPCKKRLWGHFVAHSFIPTRAEEEADVTRRVGESGFRAIVAAFSTTETLRELFPAATDAVRARAVEHLAADDVVTALWRSARRLFDDSRARADHEALDSFTDEVLDASTVNWAALCSVILLEIHDRLGLSLPAEVVNQCREASGNHRPALATSKTSSILRSALAYSPESSIDFSVLPPASQPPTETRGGGTGDDGCHDVDTEDALSDIDFHFCSSMTKQGDTHHDVTPLPIGSGSAKVTSAGQPAKTCSGGGGEAVAAPHSPILRASTNSSVVFSIAGKDRSSTRRSPVKVHAVHAVPVAGAAEASAVAAPPVTPRPHRVASATPPTHMPLLDRGDSESLVELRLSPVRRTYEDYAPLVTFRLSPTRAQSTVPGTQHPHLIARNLSEAPRAGGPLAARSQQSAVFAGETGPVVTSGQVRRSSPPPRPRPPATASGAPGTSFSAAPTQDHNSLVVTPRSSPMPLGSAPTGNTSPRAVLLTQRLRSSRAWLDFSPADSATVRGVTMIAASTPPLDGAATHKTYGDWEREGPLAHRFHTSPAYAARYSIEANRNYNRAAARPEVAPAPPLALTDAPARSGTPVHASPLVARATSITASHQATEEIPGRAAAPVTASTARDPSAKGRIVSAPLNLLPPSPVATDSGVAPTDEMLGACPTVRSVEPSVIAPAYEPMPQPVLEHMPSNDPSRRSSMTAHRVYGESSTHGDNQGRVDGSRSHSTTQPALRVTSPMEILQVVTLEQEPRPEPSPEVAPWAGVDGSPAAVDTSSQLVDDPPAPAPRCDELRKPPSQRPAHPPPPNSTLHLAWESRRSPAVVPPAHLSKRAALASSVVAGPGRVAPMPPATRAAAS